MTIHFLSRWNSFRLFCCFSAVALGLAAQEARSVRLEGVVLTVYGEEAECRSQIPGVEVGLEGEGAALLTLTDEEGRFGFEAKPGRYRLSISMHGFYPMTLGDIVLKEQPLEGLTVVLTPFLPFHRDLPVIGPEIVPAPDLRVSFALDLPEERGAPLRGVLRLQNTGDAPQPIPLRAWLGGEPPAEALLMNATVLADFQTDAATVRVQFNGWYHCNPGGADCAVLQPGSSTQIQIELYTRISEDPSSNERLLYESAGTLKGKAAVTFALPPRQQRRRERRTESLVAEFELQVALP